MNIISILNGKEVSSMDVPGFFSIPLKNNLKKVCEENHCSPEELMFKIEGVSI